MSIVFCAQYSWPSEYSSLLLKQSVDKALSLSGKSTLLNVLVIYNIRSDFLQQSLGSIKNILPIK